MTRWKTREFARFILKAIWWFRLGTHLQHCLNLPSNLCAIQHDLSWICINRSICLNSDVICHMRLRVYRIKWAYDLLVVFLTQVVPNLHFTIVPSAPLFGDTLHRSLYWITSNPYLPYLILLILAVLDDSGGCVAAAGLTEHKAVITGEASTDGHK